jgi:hypothetical protein
MKPTGIADGAISVVAVAGHCAAAKGRALCEPVHFRLRKVAASFRKTPKCLSACCGKPRLRIMAAAVFS